MEYFWVELIHAGLYAVLVYRTYHGPEVLGQWSFYLPFVFTTFLTLVALLDYKYKVIFEDINLFGLVISLISSPYNSISGGVWGSLLGYAAGGIFLTGIRWIGSLLFHREAMGKGDIIFAATLGAFLGWKTLWTALALSFIIGGVVSIILLSLKIKKKRDHIPFAPFLSGGAFVAIII